MAENDGTEDDVDQGCCADRCTGACGGYGFAFELAVRNLRDGTGHWAQLDGSCWANCPACASDGIEGATPLLTAVDEIVMWKYPEDLPPSATVTAYECCGGSSPCREKDIVRSDGTEEDLPGFVGMLHTGRSDLARRAKDIARGRPVEDTP